MAQLAPPLESGLFHEMSPSSQLVSIHDPVVKTPPYPHVRAQLSSFTRQYKPLEGYDSDGETDELSRVSSSLVARVVQLLADEQGDDLKGLLRTTFDVDNDTAEQCVLDLMHKHHDDISGVPFLFLTPIRRPISRPSSRTSTHSARLGRPDTPQSTPNSPLALLFKRPHTPLTSPLATNGSGPQVTSYMSAKSEYDYSTSPMSSPVLPSSITTTAQYTASLPASPLSSPRLLNAKASEFKPIQRPLSAASSNPGPRTDTPSPDLWAHSPFRASSNLAIAAPLIPESSLLTRSMTPSSLRSSHHHLDEDSDEDPFDPFAPKAAPPTFANLASDFDTQWSNSSNSNSSRSPEDMRGLDMHLQYQEAYRTYDSFVETSDDNTEMDEDATALLTDGMTPLDVLSSVFGSTLAPSELEEALTANGYEFEKAMAWLVDKALPIPTQPAVRIQSTGGRVTVVPREAVRAGGRGVGFPGSSPPGRGSQRFVNGRPVPGGNRVCRYFVAGECLRADCRFSHDLERALCRFWLRGTCAKQENCEFLHHLPKDVDINSLNIAIARATIGPTAPAPPPFPTAHNPPADDFPVLGYENGNGATKGRRGGFDNRVYNDPSRTRFAAAVKKSVASPISVTTIGQNHMVTRDVLGSSTDNANHRSAIVAPRPSPRIKLRAPALLPTLTTGETLNKLYMAYRSRALQLGSARNACLSRAADAWRRGDGAAAKRFSREGHELNAKMNAEMATAANDLVAERVNAAEQAVRSRDNMWSNDANDRGSRGQKCGAGLGVCLGIASTTVGDGTLTSEERKECLIDLHGLHSNEATEVLEVFLLGLEKEHFYGLAFIVVGEEKHTGTQDIARGASRSRLASGVREWLHRWGYPWNERDGIIWVDPLTHDS